MRIWDWRTRTGGEENITYHRIPRATWASFGEFTVCSAGMFGLQVKENQAILVNLADGQALRSIRTGNGALKKAVMDGQAANLLTIDSGGNAQLWDLKTGRSRETLGRLNGNVFADFSSDGKKLFLAAVEENQTACGVWDVATLSRLASWNSPPGLIRSEMSPDGKLLALGFGSNKPVVVHDLSTGAVLRSIPLDPRHGLQFMAFDPSGARLLITSSSGENILSLKPYASLWDIDKRTKVFSLHGIWNNSGTGLVGVQFSPDGSRIVTGNLSGILQIWHGRTGQLLLTISDLEGVAVYPHMTEDGRLFAYYADRTQAFLLSISARPESRNIAFSLAWNEAESKRRRELTEVGRSWHEGRMAYEVQQKHWFAAVYHAERLASRFPKEDTIFYNCARVHALAAGDVKGDAALSERYAARAVALLRQAIQAGYKKGQHMRKDSDLDALRSREDFRALLKKLDAQKP